VGDPVIPALDLTLAAVVRSAGFVDAQIGFQPPDERWRERVRTQTVSGRPAPSVNIYLFDVRENRILRTNAVHHDVSNGLVRKTEAPFRVECQYLVTAWSAARDSEQFAATVAEHRLLSLILAAFAEAAPLNPSRILPLAALGQVPAIMRDTELPTRVAPPDGYPKVAEFWGTMGDGARFKPAAHLAVTIPLAFDPQDAGGIVETIMMDVGRDAGLFEPPAEAERTLVIGGVVLDARPPNAATPVPVAGARVDLLSSTGTFRAATTTSPTGEFSFAGLVPGSYRLAYSHALIPAHAPQPLAVPAASGPVQLIFT
jgi:hypothetical protein